MPAKKKSAAATAAARELREASGKGAKSLAPLTAEYGDRVQALTPAAILGAESICSGWRGMKLEQKFKHVRSLTTSNDFVESVLYLKECFFNDGWRFVGTEGDNPENPASEVGQWVKKTGFDFARVVNDVWSEWLACDNVVVFWTKPPADLPTDAPSLPTVTVMECEICDYGNVLGVETLKIRLPKVTLNADGIADLKRKGLAQRYIDAMKDGKSLTVSDTAGERFRVLTRAKVGKGLAEPRIGSILQALSTMELLGLGDWSGASQMKKVMRQVRKGHAITQGPRSGMTDHFLKKTEQAHILKGLKGKEGPFDAATNFDVKIEFPFLNPLFFDEKKYAGTLARLARWAGPISSILSAGLTPNAMDMFETEGRRQRQLVGRFLDSIFNHPDFLGETQPPPTGLVSRWSSTSFTSKKMLIELTRFAQGNGLMSPQTAREYLDLDDKVEGDRLAAAAKKPDRFTPPFEAKQGMANGKANGRPNEAPHPAGDATASTS